MRHMRYMRHLCLLSSDVNKQERIRSRLPIIKYDCYSLGILSEHIFCIESALSIEAGC